MHCRVRSSRSVPPSQITPKICVNSIGCGENATAASSAIAYIQSRTAAWGAAMQKLLRAVGATVAVAVAGMSTAWGADMPVKAPIRAPAAAAVYNWTGFYVGGNIGG